jgi:hypothetical protein
MGTFLFTYFNSMEKRVENSISNGGRWFLENTGNHLPNYACHNPKEQNLNSQIMIYKFFSTLHLLSTFAKSKTKSSRNLGSQD